MRHLKKFESFTQAQFEPIKSFTLNDNLNPKIWNNYKIDDGIKNDLVGIAYDYLDYLDIPKVEIKDIVLTGSLANFNWSKYSDFDLHIIFDFSDIDENVDLVRKYLDAKEKVWKLQHDINIKEFPVELFCEEYGQKNISTGIYSLLNDKWVIKPTKQSFKIDEDLIRKKSSKYMMEVKEIEKDIDSKNPDYDEISLRIKKLWKKIKDGRRSGLDKDGEFSIENLVFKLLRRNGYIERLIEAKRKSYDKKFK